MKCHYEVLNVARDVNNEDLKKAYRKAALKWHPDKNLENPDIAKEQFQLVQQAYEVLSDSHERAWYDNHRDAILKGGLGGDYKDDSLDVFPYFSTTCYKGYGDDDDGFYSVYREVFNKIAAEDAEFMEDGDSEFEVPEFGSTTSDFKDIVQPFYSYWQDYTTKKSFSWLDQCDIRDLPNRRIAKLVEKENKKIRDRARKDRNEQIRNLVAFVRKRDKRVQAQTEIVKQQNAEKARLAEEKRKSKVRERQQKLQDYQESEWSKFSNFENELKNIEKSVQAEYGDHDTSEEEDEPRGGANENGNKDENGIQDFDALYCPACQKLFKTVKAFANHENSKKHKESVEILRQSMLEEEDDNGEDVEETENADEVEEDLDEEVEDDLDEEVEEDLDEEVDEEVAEWVNREYCEGDELSDVELEGEDNASSNENIDNDDKNVSSEKNREASCGISSDIDSDGSDCLLLAKKSKSKRNKKQTNIINHHSDDYKNEEESASDAEELSMLSKKQRRKLQQQRVLDNKTISDTLIEPSVSDQGNVNSAVDSENNVPKTKLKGKKAKDARKQKKQEDASLATNESATVFKPSDKTHSNKSNRKNVQIDSSVIDTEHCCATCVSNFSSKNKLFEHLKKSGHSVFIPNKKGNSDVSVAADEKKKGKGRRK